MPYNQALKLHLICSQNDSFDKRCNDLERFLLERGYSSKLVRKEILRVRKIPRNKLLDEEKSQGKYNELTFNITHYSVFKHLKSQLKELHVNLAYDEDHFKNNKNLKSHYHINHINYINQINKVGKCEICV